MLDRWETGVTQAVQEAAIAVSAQGACTVLVIPADVRLVQPFEIDKILAAHSGTGITIVPADTDLGSNAIVASPPTAIPFCYGANSFLAHVEQARKRGLTAQVVRSPGLCLDVDRPSDLEAVLSSALPTHAKAFLSKIERDRLCFDGPGTPAVRAGGASRSGRE
jgi:2-phospho-L-lactate guanylyltransferase